MTARRAPESGDGSTGPTATFEAEALSHLDSLYGTALRLTRNREAAEDLVQDTFVKAWRFAGRFEDGTNLRAWLFTILHNTFRNARRGAGRDPIDVDSDVVDRTALSVADDGSPEEGLLRQARAGDVRDALDRVPDAYRQAVWLRDVEEFSYAEIADMLGIPIGTVMSRLSRGRRLLIQELGRQPGTRAG